MDIMDGVDEMDCMDDMDQMDGGIADIRFQSSDIRFEEEEKMDARLRGHDKGGWV